MAQVPPEWLLQLLDAGDLEAIRAAIASTEDLTSGEIRIHLDPVCPDDPLGRARAVFETLGMHRTAARNGVLIYVSIEDRKLAVIGDVGRRRPRAGDVLDPSVCRPRRPPSRGSRPARPDRRSS